MRAFDEQNMNLQHPELSSLVAEGAVKSVAFVATSGGFVLEVTSRTTTRLLHTQRNTPRVFRNLETGLGYLRAMGVVLAQVRFDQFSPRQKNVV